MTTNPQQAWAAVSRTQAQAFLNSLWPAGEFCHLHSHTRTYFEALLGTVPDTIEVSDGLPELAQLLRAIADQLDAEREACAKAAESFDKNREWVPGSLYDTLRREVAGKIRRRSDITSPVMSEIAMLAAAPPPQQDGGHIEPPYPETLPCDVLIDGVKLHKGMHISSIFTMLNRRIEDGGGDG